MNETPNKEVMTQVNFRCTTLFKAQLEDEAWRRRVSVTKLIKQAVLRFIETENTSNFMDK